jgi:hypothetical protein
LQATAPPTGENLAALARIYEAVGLQPQVGG